MEYQTYLNEKKELYNILLQFLECQTAEDYSEYYQNLTNIFRNQKIDKNKDETALVLHLLVQISNNHRRIPDFINKIQQILQLLFNIIKASFTNSELFNILKNNKLMMLFFIKNQILSIDKEIYEEMLIINPKSRTKYHYFFYPEIKKFLENKEIEKIDQELAQYNPNVFVYFDERRKIGENESYICELIRSDSIQDFITLINRENYSVNKEIEDSIFETNPFLMENKPSLIEYAAFFGSIQIFQYLKMNRAEMNPSLWLYAIHGQNAEIIHKLESESVPLPNCKYDKCVSESIKLHCEYRKSKFFSLDKSHINFLYMFYRDDRILNIENYIELQPNDPYFILTYESIKCHHNDFARYFQDNFLDNNEIDYKMTFKYYNFDQIPDIINNDSIFYYLCNYDYSEMIDLYLLPINANKCNDITSTYKYLQKYQISKISDNKNNCGIINNYLHIQQIALPPCITEIGNNAFYSFHFLKRISIPSSVTSIGDYVFFDCQFLEHITIPFSVSSIGNHAFQGCILLKKITLPPSIKSINDYTFSGCLSLRKITIPSSVKSIGEGSFKGCTSLKEITIPSSVKSIGDYAFSDCLSLFDVSVPKSVINVKKNTFQNCRFLKDYYICEEEGSFYCLGVIIFWSIFSLLFANLLIVFIVALVWWSRIHPWFSHGYKTGKTVYQSLLTCWISFISGFLVFLLYFLYNLIIEKCSMSIIVRKKKSFYLKLKQVSCIVAYIITISLFLITIISAMIASAYALKNEKNNGESLKCLRYILDGYQGAADWVTNQNVEKQNDLNKWHTNMLDKAFKNDGSVTNYYCLNMGGTIMVFSIIAFLSIIGSIILFIMADYQIPYLRI